jgi:hypothetical protein
MAGRIDYKPGLGTPTAGLAAPQAELQDFSHAGLDPIDA